MDYSPCIVIPIYNHKDTIVSTITSLQPLGLCCYIIDDGSDEDTMHVLQDLNTQFPNVTLHRIEINQGKGGAVIAGLELAQQYHHSHAVQIDADCQHNIQDVPKLLAAAKQHQQAIVCGQPIFDASIPNIRRFARNITHFLVAVQILSLNPPDTMCGFRVYPLASTHQLINKIKLGRRMDFDIEIIVRLIWEHIEIIRIKTRVTYPEQGISHFRYLADNILISHMHIKLLFGMLLRLPQLLKQKFQHKTEPPPHWSEIKERGTSSGLWLMLWFYKLFGRISFEIILIPITCYFFIINKGSRRASMIFLHNAYKTGSKHKFLLQPPTLFSSFRHFLMFGYATIDKVSAWLGNIKPSDVIFKNSQDIIDLTKSGTGAIIISSHLGNIELCRSQADPATASRINALVFTEHAQKFNTILKKVNPKALERIIHVNHIDPGIAIRLKEKINKGELIIILGDRTPVNSYGRYNYAQFLGEEAAFSQGPFILASLLDCPVYLMFCLKHDKKHQVYFEHFANRITLNRKSRNDDLQKHIQHYANRLEYYCLKEPFQWFNFYDFWQKNQKINLANHR